MINMPEIDQREMIDACIKGISDCKRKAIISSSEDAIVCYSDEFIRAANEGRLSSEPQECVIPGGATKEDMIYLYDKRLVASNEGKKYYKKIMACAPYGRCPICGHSEANTLDHYLPKSVYYRFAVSLGNLFPTCATCNKNKTSRVANNRSEETIHPYFDDFDDEIWLVAEIDMEAGDPFGFSFKVIHPPRWSDEKYKRAKNHFEVYKLAELYRTLAARETVTLVESLFRYYLVSSSIENLREIIQVQRDAERNVERNSWKSAMLASIFASNWFWEEFIVEELMQG